MVCAVATILLLGSLGDAPSGENVIFPKDSGVLNVKDYGAKGDGVRDDTIAIQKALDAYPNGGRIVYLPNGTYKVTDTLKWPQRTIPSQEATGTTLQGQSREKVILRLPDSAPGFLDGKNPKAVIWTGQGPTHAVRNAIRNLTIDTGKKNPGAIGVQFRANNQGCMRDVTIQSGDRKAITGLDMAYTEANGPLLIKNVKVVGFDFGIRAAGAVNSVTLENITLQDQNRFGIVNEGQCLSLRGLTTRGDVAGILNSGRVGVLTLLDADFRGGKLSTNKPAVMNEGFLYASNIQAVGFVEPIRNAANSRRPEPGRMVNEFVSHSPVGDLAAPPQPLIVKETPIVPWDDLKHWASPTHFGAKPNDELDDSDAIQKAIDSGKTTLYFPCGSYKIRKPILVRGKVRRLLGCESTLDAVEMKSEPMLRVVDGDAPAVVIEQLNGTHSPTPTFDNTSKRTLAIRDCDNVSGRFTGPGDLYLEDVCSSPSSDWRFGKQNVWARQLSVGNEGTHIVNNGAKLWILGFKTERGGSLIETKGGGVTEVRGGLCCTTSDPKDSPMFAIEHGGLIATVGESCTTGKPYEILVKTSAGELKRDSLPERSGGRVLPLYVSPVASSQKP